MREPANLTAVEDIGGGTWVRVDDCPGRYGTWWPICDGAGWDPAAAGTVGQARQWADVEAEQHGPFLDVTPDRTARAVALVRAAVAR